MKQLLIFIFIHLTINTIAQNYDNHYFLHHFSSFISEDGNIKNVRIDSVKAFGGDSVFYNFCSIRDTSINSNTQCRIDPKGSSWIGHLVIKRGNILFFVNKENDTLELNTQQALNTSAVLYKYLSGAYLTVKVIGINYETILGKNDSVKKYELNTFDKNGTSINSDLNKKIISVGKYFGLITLFNFYPDFSSNQLLSITEEPILNNSDIYDFSIGDEFHYSTSNNMGPTAFTITKILQKTSFPDSVVYQTQEIAFLPTYKPNPAPHVIYDTVFTNHTLNYGRLSNNVFKELPDQTNFSPDRITDYLYYRNNNYGGLPYYETGINIKRDSCIPTKYSDPETTFHYVKGCGSYQTYYYDYGGGSSSSSARISLIYYKKGSKTWGSGVSINEISLKKAASIFPSPATKEFYITYGGYSNFKLEIYSALGTLMEQMQILPGTTTIPCASWSKGIYIIKMITEKEAFTQKLIKE